LNPYNYIKAFAWISIVALCCSIFESYWVPMLIGAMVITVLVKIALAGR